MGLVLWKPLYFTSIVMFVLSVVLLPFNSSWSIVTILALITLWSRVPGLIHFVFNKLSLHDLFTFIIAVHVGIFPGILFNAFGMLVGRIFGPHEWWPYTLRATLSGIPACLAVPFALHMAGGVNFLSFTIYELSGYIAYYTLVILFWREEIPLEMALLPIVAFFDFFMNIAIIKMFHGTLENMFVHGIHSGWPFILVAGMVLGFFVVSRNAKSWGPKLEPYWNRFTLKTKATQKDTPKEIPIIQTPVNAPARDTKPELPFTKTLEKTPSLGHDAKEISSVQLESKRDKGLFSSIIRRIGS